MERIKETIKSGSYQKLDSASIRRGTNDHFKFASASAIGRLSKHNKPLRRATIADCRVSSAHQHITRQPHRKTIITKQVSYFFNYKPRVSQCSPFFKTDVRAR